MATPREELEELRALASRQQLTPRQELEQLRGLAQQQAQQPVQQAPAPQQPATAQPPVVPPTQQEFPETFRQTPLGALMTAIPTEIITGAERQTEATRALPEIGAIGTGDIGRDFQIAAGLLASADPADQIATIKSAVPEAKFEADEKGNIIVDIGGKRAVLNQPGFSSQDALNATAQVLAFIPSASIASLGKNLLQKMGLGATTAAATEAGIQEIAVGTGAEEARKPGKVALAGFLGLAAETVMPAIQAIRQARAAKQVGAPVEELGDVARAAEEVRPATEATGVELFPAQQTQAAEALLEQRLVAQLPAGSRKAAQALRKQNEQSAAAVNDFLDLIAPPEAVVAGPAKFRTAAQNSIKAIERSRKEAASPIYKQAFRRQRQGKLGLVNTDQLETKIENIVKQFDEADQIAINLNKVLNKIQNTKGNLQKLHIAKTEIDQIIEGRGENAIGRITRRFLTDAQKDLVVQLKKQSPSYRAANEEFQRLSPPVTEIKESIIGKIAEIDDTQLKRISGRIFDPAETNPQVILKAKKLINDVDPDAWNQLLRSEIERRIGGLRADISAETIENIPGQIHRVLFGNEKSRRILFKSVDGETAKNMKYLETVLKRASTGRAPGSPTIPFEEIRSRLNKGVLKSIRDTFRQPIQTFAATGEEAQLNRVIKNLADKVFDPQWKPQMQKLRKLNPNSPAAARAMAQLLKDEE